MQIGNKELVPGSLLTIIGFLLVSGFFFLFYQHLRHKMILMIKRYLSAYNEYCEVSVEGAYIDMKLRIGNRESGTGNWFLVPYLSKCLGYFKIIDREQGIGNREPGSSSLFLILVCNTNISKVQIGNKQTVPGSFLTIILFILVSGFVYFISM